MAAIVATALDIARAMLHLHTENIIHSDLKVSTGCESRGEAEGTSRKSALAVRQCRALPQPFVIY
jgi:hypothetical protein